MRAPRPHSSDTLAPGQRIGPFVLLAPMGVGGSGRIWAVARVGQLGFNKRMVLKVMRQDKLSSERARARFDREACLGGRLSHESVRAVHDLGSHEGTPFMAMSWVDTSLEELLEHAPGRALPPEVACWIGMQCCAALSAAHEFVDHEGERQPIVHRDVSPGNILLTADGHALLADVTAPAGGANASPRADAGTRFFGSLGYAAPEALRQEPLDGRADLFSLGAVLFEALTGSPAFEGDDERRVVFQILEGAPPELGRLVPGIPDDIAAVIQRCLERRRELRFQSAAELRAALSACCGQLSAFNLEQRAARVMHEVLGGLIREREEALHLAFQRFAPSPFERTDTLPILAASGSRSLGFPPVDAAPTTTRDSERGLSRSGAGMAISERRHARRVPVWVAAGLLGAFALFALYQLRHVPLEGSSASSAVPAREQGPSPAAPGGSVVNEPPVAPAAPAGGSTPPRGAADAAAAAPSVELPTEPASAAPAAPADGKAGALPAPVPGASGAKSTAPDATSKPRRQKAPSQGTTRRPSTAGKALTSPPTSAPSDLPRRLEVHFDRESPYGVAPPPARPASTPGAP